MKVILASSILAIGMAASFGARAHEASEGYIYKFTDGSGHPVYTDRLPEDERGEFAVLSGKSGVIKKVVGKQLTHEEYVAAEKKAAVDKKRSADEKIRKEKDLVLLNMYSSPEEIEKMKKYELSKADQAIRAGVDNVAALSDKVDKLKRDHDNAPQDSSISTQYEIAQKNLASAQSMLDGNKEIYSKIEAKYDADEARYVELTKQIKSNKDVNK